MGAEVALCSLFKSTTRGYSKFLLDCDHVIMTQIVESQKDKLKEASYSRVELEGVQLLRTRVPP